MPPVKQRHLSWKTALNPTGDAGDGEGPLGVGEIAMDSGRAESESREPRFRGPSAVGPMKNWGTAVQSI